MKRCLVLLAGCFLLLFTVQVFAQQEDVTTSSPTDAFWVSYWAQPPVILNGPPEAAFNQGIQDILFPVDVANDPSNPDALENNIRYLQEHPDVRFYIHGYASTIGAWDYNLLLSQRRADFVKQTLVDKGISEDRIVSSVGWGQMYPECVQPDEACWNQNQVVRFVYSPD